MKSIFTMAAIVYVLLSPVALAQSLRKRCPCPPPPTQKKSECNVWCHILEQIYSNSKRKISDKNKYIEDKKALIADAIDSIGLDSKDIISKRNTLSSQSDKLKKICAEYQRKDVYTLSDRKELNDSIDTQNQKIAELNKSLKYLRERKNVIDMYASIDSINTDEKFLQKIARKLSFMSKKWKIYRDSTYPVFSRTIAPKRVFLENAKSRSGYYADYVKSITIKELAPLELECGLIINPLFSQVSFVQRMTKEEDYAIGYSRNNELYFLSSVERGLDMLGNCDLSPREVRYLESLCGHIKNAYKVGQNNLKAGQVIDLIYISLIGKADGVGFRSQQALNIDSLKEFTFIDLEGSEYLKFNNQSQINGSNARILDSKGYTKYITKPTSDVDILNPAFRENNTALSICRLSKYYKYINDSIRAYRSICNECANKTYFLFATVHFNDTLSKKTLSAFRGVDVILQPGNLISEEALDQTIRALKSQAPEYRKVDYQYEFFYKLKRDYHQHRVQAGK